MKQISKQCQSLGKLLTQQKMKLAVAESCTGGWLSSCIIDVPGSSNWFDRGFITYSNDSKVEQLSVNTQDLATYGAVSEEVAQQMAQGVIQHSHADYSIAITGIAGPSGGTRTKPVGTVWFGWANKNTQYSQCCHFFGNRELIRHQAVITALKYLRNFIKDESTTDY